MGISRAIAIAGTSALAACHCATPKVEDTEDTTEGSSSEGTSSDDELSSSSSATTGLPFDASPWVGRYHFENVFLPFGERGDPHGSYKLANFEIFADSRAELFHDECSFDEPIIIAYHWEIVEPGWLHLRPGEGEASLRFGAAENLDSVRAQLIEPCRQLVFEIDGISQSFGSFHPGASCWVDRCTQPNQMQVWYCEGEEPPPCP
jgi:hypothetical protein